MEEVGILGLSILVDGTGLLEGMAMVSETAEAEAGAVGRGVSAKLSETLEGYKTMFEGVQGIVGAVIEQVNKLADAIGETVGESIKLGAQHVEVMTRLEAVSHETAGAVDRFAEAELRTLRISPQVTASQAEIITSMTHLSGETLVRATAAAQNWQAMSHKSWKEAAEDIGAYIGGQATDSFEKYGIQLVKTDDKLAALDSVTQATADGQRILHVEANSGAGIWAGLGKAIEDYKEHLGTTIINNQHFQKAIQALTEAIENLADKGLFDKIIDGAAQVVEWFAKLVDWVSKAWDTLVKIKDVIEIIYSPLLGIRNLFHDIDSQTENTIRHYQQTNELLRVTHSTLQQSAVATHQLTTELQGTGAAAQHITQSQQTQITGQQQQLSLILKQSQEQTNLLQLQVNALVQLFDKLEPVLNVITTQNFPAVQSAVTNLNATSQTQLDLLNNWGVQLDANQQISQKYHQEEISALTEIGGWLGFNAQQVQELISKHPGLLNYLQSERDTSRQQLDLNQQINTAIGAQPGLAQQMGAALKETASATAQIAADWTQFNASTVQLGQAIGALVNEVGQLNQELDSSGVAASEAAQGFSDFGSTVSQSNGSSSAPPGKVRLYGQFLTAQVNDLRTRDFTNQFGVPKPWEQVGAGLRNFIDQNQSDYAGLDVQLNDLYTVAKAFGLNTQADQQRPLRDENHLKQLIAELRQEIQAARYTTPAAPGGPKGTRSDPLNVVVTNSGGGLGTAMAQAGLRG